MIDPDATGGNVETQAALHTLQGNFTCSTSETRNVGNTSFYVISSNSTALAPFIAPDPQSGIHRYTLLVFHQPENYSIPAALEYAMPLNTSNVTNRLYFNVEEFADNLTTVAGTYYDVVASSSNATATSGSSPPETTAPAASSTPTSMAIRLGGDSLDIVRVALGSSGGSFALVMLAIAF